MRIAAARVGLRFPSSPPLTRHFAPQQLYETVTLGSWLHRMLLSTMMTMTLEQLVGKYTRLRAELVAAYSALFWDTRHIARLDDEIEATGVAITQAQPLDEQTNDTMPAHFWASAHEEAVLIPPARRDPAVATPQPQ